MRRLPLIIPLLLSVASYAQTTLDQQFPITEGTHKQVRDRARETDRQSGPIAPSWLPRPIILGGLQGAGGYSLAGTLGAGLTLNAARLRGDFEALYANGRKIDDGTPNNRKGHERFLQGGLFYPVSRRLYVGGGARWSETSTTNYTKRQWRPTIGLGGDHFGDDLSCRWQVEYVTKGSDKLNAVQGPEFALWLPSPRSRSHFFMKSTLGVYEFHATITDPQDRQLTEQQTQQRGVFGVADAVVGWRF